jgi:predicted transcriptional regulator
MGMSPDKILSLSDIDIQITDILTDVGLKSGEARVLVVLFKGYDLTSREVERISDLRQPEVSIAINQLIKRNWVYVTSHNTEKKGRPVKIYSLQHTVDEILDEIKGDIEGDYRKKKEIIERVRVLVKEARETE